MIECICHIAHVCGSTRSGAGKSDLMLARAVYVNHETERLNRNDQERECERWGSGSARDKGIPLARSRSRSPTLSRSTEVEINRSPDANARFDPDAPVVALDYLLDDGQTRSNSAAEFLAIV